MDALDAEIKKLNENTLLANKIYMPRRGMLCLAFQKSGWNRGRITTVHSNGMCSIWLVDVGESVEISWKYLRKLDARFLKVAEGATQCLLSDVTPLSRSDSGWAADSTALFRLYANHKKLTALINEVENGVCEISLYINRKDSTVCVNAMMVKRGKARWTSSQPIRHIEYNESTALQMGTNEIQNTETSSVSSTQSKTKDFRSKIKMVHINSPGEFYVSLVKNLPGIDKMMNAIQQIMDTYDFDITPQPIWTAGNHCCVRSKLLREDDTHLQWYRGLVLMVTDTNSCSVFLRDYGIIVNAPTTDMAPIQSFYDCFADGAIRCHLACVKPTGGLTKWSSTSIDGFIEIVNRFETLRVSRYKNRTDESISVILWGVTSTCIDPLAPNTYQWVNINTVMVHNGLVHLYEKMNVIDDDDAKLEDNVNSGENFEKLLNQLENVSIQQATSTCHSSVEPTECNELLSLCILDDIVNEPIESWLPAEPIQKSVFVGKCTYVDSRGVIYMYDHSQHPFIDKMDNIIQEQFANSKSEPANTVWNVNEPCVAKYHINGFFYRAIVRHYDRHKKTYKVHLNY